MSSKKSFEKDSFYFITKELADNHLTDSEIKYYSRHLNSKKNTKFEMALSIGLVLTLAVLFYFLLNMLVESGQFTKYEELKTKITTAISNGAQLDVVKNIYDNRKPVILSGFEIFKDKTGLVPYSTTLEKTLNDVLSDQFLNENSKSLDIDSIRTLIIELQQKSPFDKLTNQQRYYLDNIRVKSGENYPFVEEDMLKISDELYNKNILTEKYLSSSNSSLYISIFSLIFALIISSYQLWSGRNKVTPESLRQIIAEIINSKEEEKEEEPANQGHEA